MSSNLLKFSLTIILLICSVLWASATIKYELISYEYKLVPTTKSPHKLPWAWQVKSKEVFIYLTPPTSDYYVIATDTMFDEQISYKAKVEIKRGGSTETVKIKDIEYYDAQITNIFNSNQKNMLFKVGNVTAFSRVTIEREYIQYNIPFTTSFNLRLQHDIDKYELNVKAPKGVALNFMVSNKDDKVKLEEKVGASQSSYKLLYENSKAATIYENGLGLDFFVPTVFFNVKSWQADNQSVEFLSSVANVKKLYNELFYKRIASDNLEELKPLATELFASCTTDEQKVDKVMYWVRSNISYLAFGKEFAGWVPQAAHVTYKKRYGDCKAVSHLIEQLLKLGGVKATKTLIGTATMVEDIVTMPTFSAFNHMVVIATINGGKYLLDGTTSPYHDWRIPPATLLNKNALMLDDEQLIFKVSDRTRFAISHQVDGKIRFEGNNAIIKFTTKYTKFDAGYSSVRTALNAETSKEDKLNHLTKLISQHLIGAALVVDSSRLPSEDDLTGPIQISITATVPDAIKQFGDQMYYNPEDAFLTVPFYRPDPSREDPMQSPNSTENHLFNFEIEIPKGWVVSAVPPPFNSEDSAFSSANIRHWTQDDQRVCFMRQFVFKGRHYYYTNGRMEQFSKHYESYVNNQNQFLVFSRKK